MEELKTLEDFVKSVFYSTTFRGEKVTAQFVFDFLDSVYRKNPDWQQYSLKGVPEIKRCLIHLENDGFLDSQRKRRKVGTVYDDISEQKNGRGMVIVFYRRHTSKGSPVSA